MRFLFLFIVILASALFLFGSAQDVLATHSSTPHCKDITGGWKNVNFPCAIQFGDAGGAQLGTCEYRVVGSTTPSYTQVSCSGSGPVYKDITINVGSSGPCDVQGLDSCNLQLHATDNSGNDIQNNTYFYDIEYTKPTVSANNQSSQWFTSRQTTLSVSDVGGSNLVEKRWSWNTDVGVLCNTGGTTFE
ncbi:MAG: hypothetical protein Q7K38_01315, partial [Candidatus Wildermuthbacteria bacterium]|nr:hypothetical protein [Candidatus Wildermuthbacteria bacterium]